MRDLPVQVEDSPSIPLWHWVFWIGDVQSVDRTTCENDLSEDAVGLVVSIGACSIKIERDVVEQRVHMEISVGGNNPSS